MTSREAIAPIDKARVWHPDTGLVSLLAILTESVVAAVRSGARGAAH